MQSNFQEPLFPPSRRNPFKQGDIVFDATRGLRGEVTHVWKKWVRFEVIGEKSDKGLNLFLRRPYTKLQLHVSRKTRAAAALTQLAEQIKTLQKKNLWKRAKRGFQNILHQFKSKKS